MDVCGFRESFTLREYQIPIVDEALKEFEEKSRQNVFISLPQGTGKTIIALATLSKLVNDNKVKKVYFRPCGSMMLLDNEEWDQGGSGLQKQLCFS
jgi:ERCC4-related helicase